MYTIQLMNSDDYKERFKAEYYQLVTIYDYVCGCKSCRTAFPDEKYDHNRPIGLLTHPNEEYGNVRVYTDTMEFVKFDSKK